MEGKYNDGNGLNSGHTRIYNFQELTTVTGCDSVAVLNLTITQPDTLYVNIAACDSVEWNGQTYTESGVYTNTYTNANGCDSVVTLDLIINNSDNTSSSLTTCDEFTWDGQTYTESGEYTNTYTNTNGCDSTHTLNLTINNGVVFFEDVSACGSYEWNGTTYTESGTYSYSELNNNEYSMSFDGTDEKISINPNSDFIFNEGFNISFWGLTEIDFNSESFIYLRNDNLENQPIIYVRHSENDVNHDNISIRGTLNEVNIPIELPEQEWFYFYFIIK